MGVVNVVTFCLVIISDATNEFLSRDNKDVLSHKHDLKAKALRDLLEINVYSIAISNK